MDVEPVQPPGLYRAAFDLAERYGLPAIYDSTYVALAELRGCDFWTADLRLFNTFSPQHPRVRLLRQFVP
jgi:predicted nucleic acid-binding protein